MYVEFHYYYFENKKYQQNEFKRLYEELQKKSRKFELDQSPDGAPFSVIKISLSGGRVDSD